MNMSKLILKQQQVYKLRFIDIFIASFRRWIFLGFVMSFVLSILLKTPVTQELNLVLNKLSKTPYDPALHSKLTYLYSQTQDKAVARRELNLAQAQFTFITPLHQVLGTTSDFSQAENLLDRFPVVKKQEFYYWQKLAIDHPQLRESWVQLLYLAYNEGSFNEAKLYLNKIRALDPNYILSLPLPLKQL